MNNKLDFSFVAIASIMQNVYFKFINPTETSMIFVSGLEKVEKYHPLDILALYMPILFCLLYFSGRYKDKLEGYGRLLIIRCYSKNKLVLKEVKNIFKDVILVFILQTMVGVVFSANIDLTNLYLFISLSAGYIITMVLFVCLQFFLEFYIQQSVTNLIVVVYGLIALFVQLMAKSSIINYIFFPANMFGELNGAINNNFKFFTILIFELIIICIIVKVISLCFKKKDIY